MNTTKAQQIEKYCLDMLEQSNEAIKKSIKRALISGAIDVDGWEQDNNPMLLPKAIMIAVLESEASQYRATGTSFEKEVNKEAKNIKLFI